MLYNNRKCFKSVKMMTSLHYDSIFVGINVSRVIYSSIHIFLDREGINFRTLHSRLLSHPS